MPDAIYSENEIATYKTNSLGYPLVFKGPNSNEVFDRRAGKVGATLEGAVNDEVYRGTLPAWQDDFAEYLKTTFGDSRKVNEKATADAKARSKNPEKVKDVVETVRVFHNRIKATLSDEDKKALAVKAQEIADKHFIDPSPSTRAAGLEKGYREKAEGFLTLPDDQLEAKITKFLGVVEGFDLQRDEEGKPTVESLGQLIKQYVEAMMEA